MKNKHDASSPSTTTQIPSGFPQYRTQMFLGFAIMTGLYCISIANFGIFREILQLPPSAPEYCQSQPGDDASLCWRADLFAFELVSGLALMWCGYKGFCAWHIKKIQKMIPNTPEGRLFGYIEEGHTLTAVSTTFQLFDLGVSLLIPEQRQFLFLCHHIMAATVSWYGLNNQYFHYYGVFYLGCSEISTIPLVAIDLAKFFPPEPGSNYDFLAQAICGPLFAITFTYYRVILWWTVGYQMFQDIFHVLRSGNADRMRPGRNHVLYVMMLLNLLLGALQLYWFTIILGEAMEFLGFGANEDAQGIEGKYQEGLEL
ncbi:TLC domain containing protein [Nitzschia inconspicua]|uniref:TLC domain containing protein n=1 Tax=Nitzschia inconspicua TaxID=303405 RepID=A0A9K3L039_9STRA|nr:TLC domain containing protein [Nitzschia inconspicua]